MSSSAPRIVVAGFLHEADTFTPSKAGFDPLVCGGDWPALATGEAMIEAVRDTNVGAIGVIDAVRALGWWLPALYWWAASSSAHVAQEAHAAGVGAGLSTRPACRSAACGAGCDCPPTPSPPEPTRQSR